MAQSQSAANYLVCDNCGVTFQRAPSNSKSEHFTYCSFSCRNNHIGADLNLEPSETLAYLLGVVYGDGHISSDRFILTVTSEPFARSVFDALTRIGFAPSYRVKSVEQLNKIEKPIKATRPQHVVSAYSRSFSRWFCALSLSDIESMLSQPEYQLAFLRGFYESEGSVRKDSLLFSNTDRVLMDMAQRLTTQLGFDFRIRVAKKLPSGKTLYSLSISAKHAIADFLAAMKPCIRTAPRQPSAPVAL